MTKPTLPESIVVVARWEVAADSVATVLKLAAEVAPQSLAEPGCLGYEILQGLEQPTTLVLIERYADRASLEAHLDSPHYRDLVAGQIRPLLTGRHVEIMQPREAPA